MDSGMTKTIGLAAVTAFLAVFVARADGSTVRQANGTLSDSALRDSTATPKWLNDGNLLALLGVMNARHVAAADFELSSWHSDTIRALAASMAREHAELQRSADSLAGAIHLAPVAPALADSVNAAFQIFIDSLYGARGPGLDRAYVRQQVASHKLMATWSNQLSALAARPEVSAFLGAASARAGAQASRAQSVLAMYAVRDSIVADSLARRAARRNRSTTSR